MNFTRIIFIFPILFALTSPVAAHQENRVTIYSNSPDGKYLVFLRETGKTQEIIDSSSEYIGEYATSDLFIAKRTGEQSFTDERLLQTGVATPTHTAGGFTLEIQIEWTTDNHWLVYRWRDTNQREQIAVYDRFLDKQHSTFIMPFSIGAKIPAYEVILDALSKDGQFIALQQSDRIIFYRVHDFKRILPRGAAPTSTIDPRTCYRPYDAVKDNCVFWSPTGHYAAFGVKIGKEAYLRLFNPDGKTKESLFKLRDIPYQEYPAERLLKWSPGGQYLAVMTLLGSNSDSSSLLVQTTLDLFSIDGTAHPSIAENIIYATGTGVILIVDWCKPNVFLYVEKSTLKLTAYDIARNRYEKSNVIYDENKGTSLVPYRSQVASCK